MSYRQPVVTRLVVPGLWSGQSTYRNLPWRTSRTRQGFSSTLEMASPSTSYLPSQPTSLVLQVTSGVSPVPTPDKKSFAAFAAVSSQVLGGSDFLSSRSTSDKTAADNQIAAQYPPPDVEQQVQQYYQPQPVQYYQPTAEQQQQQPEYYQQQQLQQQYAQNFNSAAEKQVGRSCSTV